MSLISHSFLPRSMFDMDTWIRPINTGTWGPTTLDMFDPFDDLDRMMSRNIMWLDKPSFLDFPVEKPRVPKKYRISLDCHGYKAKNIKSEVKDNQLIITGCQGAKQENAKGDYSIKEFKKTYKLPENVESDKLVSFLTSNGQLIVEFPLKEQLVSTGGAGGGVVGTSEEALFPKIVDEGGQKCVSYKMSLPNNIDPSKVKVTCKDRDLIVQAENKDEKQDSYSQTYYYQRTTLPEDTDFNKLKCTFDNNQLSIKAPLIAGHELRDSTKSIPIEYGKQQQQQQQQQQPQQQQQQGTQISQAGGSTNIQRT